MAKKKETIEVKEPTYLKNGNVEVLLFSDKKIHEISKQHAATLVKKGAAQYK